MQHIYTSNTGILPQISVIYNNMYKFIIHKIQIIIMYIFKIIIFAHLKIEGYFWLLLNSVQSQNGSEIIKVYFTGSCVKNETYT